MRVAMVLLISAVCLSGCRDSADVQRIADLEKASQDTAAQIASLQGSLAAKTEALTHANTEINRLDSKVAGLEQNLAKAQPRNDASKKKPAVTTKKAPNGKKQVATGKTKAAAKAKKKNQQG